MTMNTRFLEVEGGKISYEDTGEGTGSGPLVVLVPGMGSMRGEYRILAPQLAAAGYRAISMDLRGEGESSTNWTDFTVSAIGSDVLALIRSLDAGPAMVIGASYGAGAAISAAGEAPELVRGLVLIGPVVRGEGSRLSKLFYSALLAPPWGPGMWLRYIPKLYPSRKPADFAQYCAALKANLEEPGRMEAFLGMINANNAGSEERLARVKAPALVVMGSQDADFKDPRAEAEWVANRLNGRYEIVEGAGHYPHAEMPEVTGPLVLSFLRTLMEVKEGANVA
jgi:pimeloyl-ACP methyl ester carboxylesterase